MREKIKRKQFPVFLSEEEKEIAQKLANKLGLSVGALFRYLLLRHWQLKSGIKENDSRNH